VNARRAPATVAALAVGVVAAMVGPVGVATADPAIPTPPPVDMRQLPTDTRPAALPGLRHVRACAEPADADRSDLNALSWGVRSMRLDELHAVTTGAGVRLAVIDSGVARHPLLAGRLHDGGDYVAGGSALVDCEGHGTAVAGIAAASADRTSGFSGVAPGAEVIAIRQTSASYVATGTDGHDHPAGSVATLASAIVRAVDLGARVINISAIACVPADRAGRQGAGVQAAVRHAVRHDVVVVVAAGNRGSGGSNACPVDSGNSVAVLPAWYDDDVLAVASMAPDGTPSQFGIRAPWVDVAAPGEQLVSLSPNGTGLTDKIILPTQDSTVQGSSFAAPAVAGLAVLIRARYPELSARQVMDRITATATRPSGAGRSDAAGWGTVDAVAALTRAPAVLDPPSEPDRTVLAGTAVLALPPPDPARTAAPGALWGGALGVLATVVVGALGVLRNRRPG
jgi:membrane-anchored mycosin MYCP